jgi:beta-glucanase (GH16 family)
MTSEHKVFFNYGRIDIRAKLPFSQGLWPALWMMGENRDVVGWSECGEIDIMELRGHTPNQISSTIHFKNSAGSHQFPTSKKKKLSFGDYSDEFHVISMEWDEYKIQFFVDDQRYSTIFHNNFSHYNDSNPFRKEFYILMNVAVGGDFGGNPNNSTIWPQTMEVDYVRVYQKQ